MDTRPGEPVEELVDGHGRSCERRGLALDGGVGGRGNLLRTGSAGREQAKLMLAACVQGARRCSPGTSSKAASVLAMALQPATSAWAA